jgi:L-amino acid N-acyltransferase YncA
VHRIFSCEILFIVCYATIFFLSVFFFATLSETVLCNTLQALTCVWNMRIELEPVTLADREEIIDIFNYYTENSFAAYTASPLSYEVFDSFMQLSWGYPAVTARDEFDAVIGFGMLRPYSSIPAFSATAEMTCFIKHGYTGRGVGKIILEYLVSKAHSFGISSILVSISSLNESSVRFHKNNGFSECGRLKGVGTKRGVTFDVIYCQKMI